MPTTDINGAKIYYECAGEGPVLLLIHGLGSSGADWAFQRDEFARNHRLVIPDLRGSGRSAHGAARFSMAEFASDLWTLLDRLGHARVDILGFSLGGAVALEMALLQPSRVHRLILCNTLANYRTDTWRKRLEAWLQTFLVRTLGLRRTAALISKRLFPDAADAAKRQRVIDVVGANSPQVYLATMRALIGWHALDRLGALQARTLIIAAEHDYTPLADKREELMRFPNAEFVVVEGSRHGTPFDATEEFNRIVLTFLASADRS